MKLKEGAPGATEDFSPKKKSIKLSYEENLPVKKKTNDIAMSINPKKSVLDNILAPIMEEKVQNEYSAKKNDYLKILEIDDKKKEMKKKDVSQERKNVNQMVYTSTQKLAEKIEKKITTPKNEILIIEKPAKENKKKNEKPEIIHLPANP